MSNQLFDFIILLVYDFMSLYPCYFISLCIYESIFLYSFYFMSL